MLILKHSNKYLLAVFISHLLSVTLIHGAPKQNISKTDQGSTSQSTIPNNKSASNKFLSYLQSEIVTFASENSGITWEQIIKNSSLMELDIKGIGNRKLEIKNLPTNTEPVIAECKMFMLQVFSKDVDIIHLNFASFMESDRAVEEKVETARICYKLAHLQTDLLDKQMLENMYNEHTKNQSKAKKSLKKAVIVGGGPNGLLAAFHLFLSGMEVVLVNDRKEDYIRNQIVHLLSNDMFQLRILLGTKFDKLFLEEESAANIGEHYIGSISLKYLEKALKNRLKSLENYMKDKKGVSTLELLFGHPVVSITLPTQQDPHYYAVLKLPNGTSSLIFDLLVCAAGSKDKIRNTYVGLPKKRTITETYGVTVLLKGKEYENKDLLSPVKQDIKNFLIVEDFKKFISNSKLLDLIPKQKKKVIVNSAKDIGKNYFKGYELAKENRYIIYIADLVDYNLASILILLKEEQENLKKDKDKEKYIKAYSNFKSKIAEMWMKVVADRFVNSHRKNPILIGEGKKKLKFDPHPVNTSIFDFSHFSLDKVAVEYNVLDQSAIVLALGDSAVNAHFSTGTGLRNGRESILQAVGLIKQYNSGIIKSTKSLVQKMNKNYEEIRQKALKDALEGANMRLVKEMKQMAVDAMHAAVNEMIEKKTFENYGFQIKRIEKKNAYNIYIAADSKNYTATVTENGEIQVENDSKNSYATMLHAALSLKNIKMK